MRWLNSLTRRRPLQRSRWRPEVFLGLDLNDPHAKRPGPCTLAILDWTLHCAFVETTHSPDVDKLLLGLQEHPFILAVDGPQGLAARPDMSMRDADRKLGKATKTPYRFTEAGRVYAGYIRGSVTLFYALYQDHDLFRLLGAPQVSDAWANLIEVYPAAAWRTLNQGDRLPSKRTPAGRDVRAQLLKAQGMSFEEGSDLTHDRLDAAMCAWIAYQFHRGKAEPVGRPPVEDRGMQVLREGYIVQPDRAR